MVRQITLDFGSLIAIMGTSKHIEGLKQMFPRNLKDVIEENSSNGHIDVDLVNAEMAKNFPFDGEIEMDGFVTVYSSTPVNKG